MYKENEQTQISVDEDLPGRSSWTPNLAPLFSSPRCCHLLALYHVSLSAGGTYQHPTPVEASTATLPLQMTVPLHRLVAIFNVRTFYPKFSFLLVQPITQVTLSVSLQNYSFV